MEFVRNLLHGIPGGNGAAGLLADPTVLHYLADSTICEVVVFRFHHNAAFAAFMAGAKIVASLVLIRIAPAKLFLWLLRKKMYSLL